jgi:hypothetical protein
MQKENTCKNMKKIVYITHSWALHHSARFQVPWCDQDQGSWVRCQVSWVRRQSQHCHQFGWCARALVGGRHQAYINIL